MLRSFILFVALLATTVSFGRELKSPSEFLGYDLGTYFTRHHQVMDYFDHLEEWSNGMMKIEEYGRTNENRKLITAFISSQENLNNLDNIALNHAKGEGENVAIVWLSYNVHGNESSCTEAAMKTAYVLLSEKQEWLKDVLVILDPCINPDGRDRYVNWYNQQMNINPNVNKISAEHNEPWPAGRFNHYLFDLNRDWAWLTQVESQQRVVVYNKWLPHVHVDFHEQFYDSPYYFAPAAPPFHEVITDWQKEFQTGLGRQHAHYFDEQGWLYFTREIFDLLYPGYGDTYPTYNGAIGMTYEQGGHGVAGLAIEDEHQDTVSLVDRIEHHHTTGLSTVEFSVKNKEKLIKEFIDFPTNQEYKYNTYVIWGDHNRMLLLADLLNAHEILYSTGKGEKIKGYDYVSGKDGEVQAKGDHIVISVNQRKGPLATVLFEPTTSLEDSVTYDLTAWSLPYAYGLNCIASEQSFNNQPVKYIPAVQKQIDREAYAFLIPWTSMSSARVLTSLLDQKVKVRFAEKPFTFGEDEYESGTLIVLKSENANLPIADIVKKACQSEKVGYATSTTGMVDKGKDFGSPDVKRIDPPKVAMLTKQGYPPTVGAYWYFFEQELKYPLTLINADNFRPSHLDDIDILIAPTGGFGMGDSLMAEWVKKGGKLIAVGSGLHNFGPKSKFSIRNKDFDEDEEEEVDEYENAHIAYSDQDRHAIGEAIQGAVYKCKVDNTNPLAFGYGKHYFTLKSGASAYNWLKEGENPVYLDKDSKPTSGFAGIEAQENQPKSMVFAVEKMGRGCAVYMVDDPLFRCFWENGKLFMANAVFFVNS